MKQILVVDDDPHIRDVICFALDKAGYDTTTARDGNEALARFQQRSTDLIVLDIGLPGKDGLEVCRQIRRTSQTPILFLSARDDEIDRVLGLEIGGDDYVTKPFSPRELVARVGVILKRAGQAGDQDPENQLPLSHGHLRLDPMQRLVEFNAEPVQLTAIEFEILKTILAHPRMVFNRERIMTAAYPANIHVSDRTIDSHIRKIRTKLRAAGCDDAIETVHGVGFRIGSCQAAG